MTATHSLPRSSAPPMAPTLTSRTTTSRILTASSTWISIAWETTFRGMIPYWMGKIFVYYWDVVSYAFFCKRPEAGKPIEVRVGDEWKTLESSAHIQIDSTGKFLQQYTYVPRGEEEWAKVSKASEVNPSYWIHWREGSKILVYPNEFIHKYSV